MSTFVDSTASINSILWASSMLSTQLEPHSELQDIISFQPLQSWFQRWLVQEVSLYIHKLQNCQACFLLCKPTQINLGSPKMWKLMDINFLLLFDIFALQTILHKQLVPALCFLTECGKVNTLKKTLIRNPICTPNYKMVHPPVGTTHLALVFSRSFCGAPDQWYAKNDTPMTDST